MEDLATAVQPEYVNIQAAEVYTGYKVSTLRKFVHLKKIPFTKKFGKVMFPLKRLREWMEEGENLPNENQAA